MYKIYIAAAILSALFVSTCVVPTVQQREDACRPAVSALLKGEVHNALDEAEKTLRRDRDNPCALLARAVARYLKSLQDLAVDLRFVWNSRSGDGGFDLQFLRKAVVRAENSFGLVESDLAGASRFSGIHMDLAPAYWQFDWNQDGRINSSDQELLEVEYDAQGNDIPPEDPRRRPTYRFDHGDVYWAHAFVNFQRAALNIVLAFEWDEINRLAREGIFQRPEIRFKLKNSRLIKKARAQILKGLDSADEARRAYLAEEDDEREWIPNPRQKDHPLPLPVDEELYRNWEGILKDVRKLVQGSEGVAMAEVALLADMGIEPLPRGYLDVGKMFSQPRDIVLDIRELMGVTAAGDMEGLMKSIFGIYYVYDIRPSYLTKRLMRMRREINAGIESFGRKLRYLLWLN